MAAPSLRARASVPAQSSSASSGWATIARIRSAEKSSRMTLLTSTESDVGRRGHLLRQGQARVRVLPQERCRAGRLDRSEQHPTDDAALPGAVAVETQL